MEPLSCPTEKVLRNIWQVHRRKQDEDTLRQEVQDEEPSLAKCAGGD